MARQDETVGRTVREHNDSIRLLQCLRTKARNLSREALRVHRALSEASSEEGPKGVPVQPKSLVYVTEEEGEKLLRDIGKAAPWALWTSTRCANVPSFTADFRHALLRRRYRMEDAPTGLSFRASPGRAQAQGAHRVLAVESRDGLELVQNPRLLRSGTGPTCCLRRAGEVKPVYRAPAGGCQRRAAPKLKPAVLPR